jgi:PhzF family phenazine biosynthesis protein
MKLSIYQIDAFTDKVFGGNPAAVVPLEKWLEKEVMQAIAAENNLSETAFFIPVGDEFEIKWFTPEIEVDLCGHATLASAYVLYEHLKYNKDEILFHSQSGILKVRKKNDLFELDFPNRKPLPVPAPPALIEGLGKRPIEVLKSRDYFAVYENEDDINSLKPDFNILSTLDALGIIVTSKGKTVDFVSRFFVPAAGINEDPVTGSAHSTLIPYWAEKLGKNVLHAYQLSKRKGELFCELIGDRVWIAGKAVTYMIGELRF